MTESELVALLKSRVEQAGSMRALAREFGIQPSYLSDLLQGRRAPGPKVLGPLGLRRVKLVTYEPIKKTRKK